MGEIKEYVRKLKEINIQQENNLLSLHTSIALEIKKTRVVKATRHTEQNVRGGGGIVENHTREREMDGERRRQHAAEQYAARDASSFKLLAQYQTFLGGGRVRKNSTSLAKAKGRFSSSPVHLSYASPSDVSHLQLQRGKPILAFPLDDVEGRFPIPTVVARGQEHDSVEVYSAALAAVAARTLNQRGKSQSPTLSRCGLKRPFKP